MIPINEALDIVLSHARPLPAEEVPLQQAQDRVLAEDVVSDCDVPPFDNSAMDGYAVIVSDLSGCSPDRPKELPIVEEVEAGSVAKRSLHSGETIKITTGAPIPTGADAVIMLEDTEETASGSVKCRRAVKKGENIRFAGEDIKKGKQVFSRGRLIRPAEMGLLASIGKTSVKVHCRPLVAIISTGNELVDMSERPLPGQIRSSNSVTLTALVKKHGGIPLYLGIVRDDLAEIRDKFRDALKADIVVSSAGVSMGGRDFVKQAMAEIGVEIKFWKVAIKPGKPIAFGTLGDTMVFGLPGNPASSAITFELFVRPAMLKLMGADNWKPPELLAVLDTQIRKKPGRAGFFSAIARVEDGELHVTSAGAQGSGILSSLAAANCLIVAEPDQGDLRAGGKVRIQLLDFPVCRE